MSLCMAETLATVATSDGGGGSKGERREESMEVRSLTVRLDGRSETWRSPPTYGTCDFDWPSGWIEVQRRTCQRRDDGRAAAPKCSLQGLSSSTPLSSPKRGSQRDNGEWIREFHPPHSARGKSMICRSIEEVVKYIERRRKADEERLGREGGEDAALAIGGRMTNKRSKNNERQLGGGYGEDEGEDEGGLVRRLSARPRTNANAGSEYSPSTSSSVLFSDRSFSREGTQCEFNRIMKNGDARSERMRSSILIGAILALKRGIVDGDQSFIGADGRMYPDLRRAFGKHVHVRQCSLCKMRVQGSWYCRIGHGHLDKPDHDGGNSADPLLELSRMGEDELVRRLGGLRRGKGDDDIRRGGKVALVGGFEGTGWSMEDLSEDLLYLIASFLPSLVDLISLCSTSVRSRRLLNGGGSVRRSEDLLRGVFLRAFGRGGNGASWGGAALEQLDLSWRDRWAMIRGLRRGLVRGLIAPPALSPDENASALRPSRLNDRISILPEHDEREAIYYDNPSHADPDAAYCNGYFGMSALRLPRPPNAGPDWRPPIVVRGDFDGIRILSSTSSLFRRGEPPIGGGFWNGDNSTRAPGEDFCVVGDDEGGGQVLSLIHCGLSLTRSVAIPSGNPTPCCFIGYASGRVAAVSATLTLGGDGYAFAIAGTHHAHDSEVTDLTFVDCGSSPRDGGSPVLFSACCGGKVYFYPHALKQNFSLEHSVLAFTNFYDCPIFSLVNAIPEFI
jgi:hypothetical protein